MTWWIVGGIVAVALVLLAVVAVGTLRRLRGLQRAAGRAQQRQPEVEALQARIGEMQESLGALQVRAETTRARAESLTEKDDTQPNSGQIAAKQTLGGAFRRPDGR